MKRLFLLVLAFRLVISFLPPMQIDMAAWQAWAMRMVSVGPQNFYSAKIFTDNPPGYLYVFWAIGHLANLTNWTNLFGNAAFEWLLKLPANLFDLGTGLLIYKIISHKRPGLARLGFLLYTLNPAIWFNSSVFGQFDGAGAFFSLLSVYFLLEKKLWLWSGVSLAFAWAVKPQAIALAPAVGILALRELGGIRGIRRIREIIMAAGVFVLTTLLLYWPFFPKNPIAGIFYVFSRMNNIYSCTTCFAFNFWGMFGNWGNDQTLFLGIPLMAWGIGLAGLGMLGILGKLIFVGAHHDAPASNRAIHESPLHDAGRIYLAIAISVMAFFMFVTRMHERYVLPFFAFFLIAAILLKSKKLMLFYLFFSGFNLLNVYYPYASYNTGLHLTPGLVLWLGENFRLLSMVGFGSFLVLCWWYLFNCHFRHPCHSRESGNPERILNQVQNDDVSLDPRVKPEDDNMVGDDKKWSKREMIIVFLLVFVSFLIRVIRLDIPRTYYFDEVYHAFTAVELEKGNKMAWEWWNTPPAGFAYEWTHPPLAKEMMVGGMKIFGNDAFGWRFPGVILGTGCVLLVYLLGRELFGKRAGFFAGFLFSFDGLSFAQARIGMNDIYFLFFMLLAFYLFIRQQTSVANGNFESASDSLAENGFRFKKNSAALANEAFQNLLAPSVFFKRNINLLFMSISLGLALAGKWTAVYGIGILGGLYLITQFVISSERSESRNLAQRGLRPRSLDSFQSLGMTKNKLVKLAAIFFLTFLVIPLTVYLLTYLPFFTSGHSWAQFDELQRQMWWYHTGLKATHPYTSPWYSWSLMQRPVWYFVEYGGNGGLRGTIANIYGMGNPVIWWAGVVAIGWMLINFILRISVVIPTKRSAWRNLAKRGCGLDPSTALGMTSLFIVLLGYFGFFLPWALSPRIMFLYHYLPSLPFLCLALGWGLDRIGGKFLTFAFLLLTFVTFIYFYPQLSALPVTKAWSDQYFWFASWR